jgi:hypothetical protein
MADRSTVEERRECITVRQLVPGMRAMWHEGAYEIPVTIQSVTEQMFVVVKLDESAFGRSKGSTKRMEPFHLVPEAKQ